MSILSVAFCVYLIICTVRHFVSFSSFFVIISYQIFYYSKPFNMYVCLTLRKKVEGCWESHFWSKGHSKSNCKGLYAKDECKLQTWDWSLLLYRIVIKKIIGVIKNELICTNSTTTFNNMKIIYRLC